MNTQQKVIKNKVGLLKLVETLGSVSHACKVMGLGGRSGICVIDLGPVSEKH
jgi:molybdenum-dependent DNA-binding transcriptional regulator ModE